MNTRAGEKGRITRIYGRKDRKLENVQAIEQRIMDCVSDLRVFELMSLGRMAAQGRHVYPEHAALCYLLAGKMLDNPGVQRELGETTIRLSRQMLEREKVRLKANHRVNYDAMLRAVRSGQLHINGQAVVVARLSEDRNPPKISVSISHTEEGRWTPVERGAPLGGLWAGKSGPSGMGSLLPAAA